METIYYARKKVSDNNVIQVFAWEAEKKRAMYVIKDETAWFKRVRLCQVGQWNAEGAFGHTRDEAITALKTGFELQAELAEKKAARIRNFLSEAVIEDRG